VTDEVEEWKRENSVCSRMQLIFHDRAPRVCSRLSRSQPLYVHAYLHNKSIAGSLNMEACISPSFGFPFLSPSSCPDIVGQGAWLRFTFLRTFLRPPYLANSWIYSRITHAIYVISRQNLVHEFVDYETWWCIKKIT